MTLTILDFVLVIILVAFGAGGFAFGLIHALGALVGTVVGAVVAANYFDLISGMIGLPFGMHPNLVKIISFVLIFIVVSRLVSLVFYLFDKFFNVLTIIPFLKIINRLAGAILGLIEGGLALGILLVFAVKFPFAGFLEHTISSSNIAKFLYFCGQTLLPLLPDFFRQAKDIIKI